MGERGLDESNVMKKLRALCAWEQVDQLEQFLHVFLTKVKFGVLAPCEE